MGIPHGPAGRSAGPPRRRYRGAVQTAARLVRARPAGYAVALAGVAAVSGLIELVSGHVNVLSMAVCYQLLVLLVSGAYGLGPGLSSGVASAGAFNWFFVPPVHTLSIADTRNWISLAVFTATAVVTSWLAEGFRRQRTEAEERRRDAELLARMAATVLGEMAAGPSTVELARAAAAALGVDGCRIVLDAPGEPGEARAPTAVTPSPDGFTVPLVAAGRPLGLLEVGRALPDIEPRWSSPGFATAVGGLAAVAVDRGRLMEAALEADALRRSDELKTALLHGVSHEFRTPLTAIRTASHALSSGVGGAERDALLEVVGEETARLDRLVANLLDLSRLEAGALTARMDWCAPDEMVAGAVDAAGPVLEGAEVAVRIPADLPLVRADPVLCERILVNLLHNAARHGRPPVEVEAAVRGGRLEISVADHGGGADPAVAERLFEPFVAGGRAPGTGVGLALARGLAEAQGATLRAAPGPGGLRVTLGLALTPVPEVAAG